MRQIFFWPSQMFFQDPDLVVAAAGGPEDEIGAVCFPADGE